MVSADAEFPSEWACSACGREFSGAPPSVCPKCGVVGAFSRLEAEGDEGLPTTELHSLAEKAPPLKVIRTGVGPVDDLLGGFPLATATTLYGPRGGGKSTLALQVAGGLAKRLEAPALIVCPEMSAEILQRTASRVKSGLDLLFPSRAPGQWIAEAVRLGARVLVIDSVSRFPAPVETLHEAIAWAREARGVALCLTHQSRRGKPLGPVALEHDTDAVLRVTLKGKTRTLAIDGKCRWAALGSVTLARE